MWRFPTKTGLVVAAGALSVALLAACAGSGSNGGATLSGLTSAQLEALGRAGSAFGGGYVQGTGIHANGVGKATAKPDVAVISLGVEGFASTVAEARDIAATAMDAMLTALREQGVAEDDLQTRYFNIQPEYTYEEIVVSRGSEFPDGTVRRSERKLIGYRVTNTLTAKVRDLDKAGQTIDAVVDAGGDATRIDSIVFTVEDGTALEAKARELAVQDAVAKADVFAVQAGVERGKLQFIAETSSPQYPKSFNMALEARAASGVPPTQINPGEFEVTVTVQTIFGID